MNPGFFKLRGLRWFCLSALLILFFIITTPTLISRASPAQITRPFTYGAWLGDFPTQSNISAYQQLTNHHLDVGQFYIDWSVNFSVIQPYLQTLAANQSDAMITWMPSQYNTQQIANGAADSYIQNFASAVRNYGKTVQLRPLHEMNGNWYSWGIGNSSVNNNSSYINAWRHIVTIFRQQGATNAKFIWSITSSNVGNGSSFTGAYPGDNYVDYVGIDGYNWGTTQSWGSTWQSFDQVFSAPYQALVQLTNKPVIIPEWASAEQGGSKAAWITDAFQQLASNKYSHVVSVDWFNMNKETDWRVNSSSATLAAYQAALGGGGSPPTPTPTKTPPPPPTPTPPTTPTPGANCKVNYTISSQWTGGFGGNILITNTGTTTITGWTLKFSFANGQTITQLWNGVYTQSGNTVTVTNLAYNGTLAPGANVNPGFNGTQNGTNSIPTAFTLNGQRCATQ